MVSTAHQPYRNIAIIRLSSLGDIIHTIPAFYLIRKHFPGSKISWFVEPVGARLLENFMGIDEVIVINLKTRGLRNKLKEIRIIRKKYTRKFDLIIDFQGLLKSAIITRLLKSQSIGFHQKNLKEPLAGLFYRRTAEYFDENKHVILKNMNLLQLIDIREENIHYPLKKIKESRKLLNFLKDRKLAINHFLLINIGGGWESKRLNTDQYIQIVNRLKANYPVVILWGNDKEKMIARTVSRVTNTIMSFYTGFDDLIGFIQKARLLISADTLALHIADMVKTPSIGLFGPTNPLRNGSLLSESISLYKKLPCGFCYKKKCDTIKCLTSITPNEIEEAVKKIYEKHN
ncbi:MAG: glycosyltransferase family 9 protein [Candidatus Aminicenantes bacterium]|nr:glycosyltransferase family 9 protein [Candidatus Aminicenantes bacterium]